MKIPHSRPILLSFGLASTALVMGALLLLEWKGGTAAVDSFEWVSHTLEVQRELATVEARMSEAEASQRGYLLTSNINFLAPYNSAKIDVRFRVGNLVTLCAWTRSVEYEGEWISFEEYLRRKFNVSATHGISPDALSQIQVGLVEPQKSEEPIKPDEELLKSAS